MKKFVKVVCENVDFVGEVLEELEGKYRLVVKVNNNYNSVWVKVDECEEVEVKNWGFETDKERLIKVIKNKVLTKKKSKVEMFLDLFEEDESLVYNRKEAIGVGVERGLSTVNGCSTFFNSAKKIYLGLE